MPVHADPRLWENALDRVLAYARDHRYAGYSKFDAFNSPVVRTLAPRSLKIRAVICALWARQPVHLRPLLRTARSRNPKGIALFALACLRRFDYTADPEDLEEARRLLDWLLDHACPGYAGPCWGYDHDWYGLHFYAPKDSPNIVVTGNVAYALLEAYETTQDRRYLDAAAGAVDFMRHDLEAPVDTPDMRNIGYIPGSGWAVLNINGLAATILSRLWRHTGDPALIHDARRLTAFLVDKQTDYGAWHYAWPAESSNVRHDNYHTGNILDWVLDYTRYSGDDQFFPAWVKGLEFYRQHLFTQDGRPKWMSHRVYPLDAHSAAQAVVTLTKAAEHGRGVVDLGPAARTADWAVRHLQTREGCFMYQQGRFLTRRYTLMRWCNAWMAYALAGLIRAFRRSEGGG